MATDEGKISNLPSDTTLGGATEVFPFSDGTTETRKITANNLAAFVQNYINLNGLSNVTVNNLNVTGVLDVDTIRFSDATVMTTAVTATGGGLSSTGDLNFLADSDANGSGVMNFSVRGVQRMQIANLGDFFIGSGSPTADPSGYSGGISLEINSNTTTTDPGLFLRRSTGTTGLDFWHDVGGFQSYIDDRFDSDDSVLHIRMRTNITPRTKFSIFGSGKIGFSETAPDCCAGGVTMNKGSLSGLSDWILTGKQDGCSHGGGSFSLENDTFVVVRDAWPNAGGFRLISLTDGDETSSYCGLFQFGLRDTADTTTSSAAVGVFILDLFQHDGANGASSVAATGNLAVFRNNSVSEHIFKGNGDIYTNTDQTSGLAGTFDSEDDIALIEAAKYAVVGYTKVPNYIKKNQKRLQKIGVMNGTYKSDQKMTNLLLGGMCQFWNVLQGLADHFNIDRSLLKEWAKQYV